MNISKQGKLEIAKYEGLMLKPYWDTATPPVLTVGLGATGSDRAVKLGQVFTMQQVIDMFNVDIVKYENSVNNSLDVDVTQSQFDALCSFQYNTGGFHGSSLRARINAGASAQSIYDGFMMWSRPKCIIGRRTHEAELYRHGTYTNDGTCDFYDVDDRGHTIFHSVKRINIAEYFK